MITKLVVLATTLVGPAAAPRGLLALAAMANATANAPAVPDAAQVSVQHLTLTLTLS